MAHEKLDCIVTKDLNSHSSKNPIIPTINRTAFQTH